MVNRKEMEQFLDFGKKVKENVAYQVTLAEMKSFDENRSLLAEMISDRKKLYEKENKISATQAYYDIEELCLIRMDTMKKVMSGKMKITRTFLYKFVVGLKMTLEEANEYFELCGGSLSEKRAEDYICIKALCDNDDIQSLVDEFFDFLNLKIG